MRLPRLWTLRGRHEVVIEPVQLVMLHFLYRFGSASLDDLFEEVRNMHAIDRGSFMTAVADAVSQEIIEHDPAAVEGERRLRLTNLGERLREKVPESTRSRMSFYV